MTVKTFQKDTHRSFGHCLQAYVVAEVQLWMLRVPVPSENESHVTPPAALDDIALALPMLLTPPHFCRTGPPGANDVWALHSFGFEFFYQKIKPQ